MSYFKLGSLFKGIDSTPTAAGTTTLTLSSKQYQQFTGTTAQTVVLPDATTLPNTRRFDILNRSTGIVTVNFNGGSLAATVPANSQRYFLLTSNATSAGSWVVGGVVASSGATVSTADKLNLLSGMGSVNASTDNIESRIVNYRPEEISGNYSVTVTALPAAAGWASGASLNGFGYSISGLDSANSSLLTANNRYTDDSNYWLARAVVTARQGASAFANGSIFFFGGSNTANLSGGQTTNQKYVDSTDSWSTVGAYPAARNTPFSFVLNSANYAGGGFDNSGVTQSDFYTYSDSNAAWYARASLPGLRGAGSPFALNGLGYVASGTNDGGSTFLATTVRYNDVANFWSTLTNNLNLGRDHTDGAAANGFGYSSCGYNGGNSLATNEEFSDASTAWITRASIATARHGSNIGFSLNGTVFYPGGRNFPSNVNIATVDKFVNSSPLNLGILKRTTTTPTSVLVSTIVRDIAANLSVQIRTDGDNWKNFTSGIDSVLKLNETISAKLQAFNSNGGTLAGGNDAGGDSSVVETYNEVQNNWTVRTVLPAARNWLTGFQLQGFEYAVLGFIGSTAQTTNTQFDEIKNTWTTKTAATTAVARPNQGFSIDDIGYIPSGRQTETPTLYNGAQKYSAVTDSWTTFTTPNTIRWNSGVWGLNGKGYLVGGWTTPGGSASTYTANIEKYTVETNAWVNSANNLPAARGSLNRGGSVNGFGYVAGGENTSGGAQSETYEFNPSTETVATKTNLLSWKENAEWFRTSNVLYICGGNDGGGFSATNHQFNALVNAYTAKTSLGTAKRATAQANPSPYRSWEIRVGIPAYFAGIGGGAWAARATVPVGASSVQGLNINNFGYVAGLSNGTSTAKYNNDTDTFVLTGSTTNNKNRAGTFTLFNLGYVTGSANSSTTASEKYSDATNSWSSITATSSTHDEGSGFSLNGFGYVVGQSSVTNGAMEKYNAATNAWSSGAALATNVASTLGETAVLNGFCYLVGGYLGGAVDGTATQKYNDAANTWVSASATYPVAASFKSVVTINGVLHSAGGHRNSVPDNIATAATYKDTTNEWTTVNSMSAVRYAPSSFAINNTRMSASGNESLTDRKSVV